MAVTTTDRYTIPIRRDGQIEAGGSGNDAAGKGGVPGGTTVASSSGLLTEVTARESADTSLSSSIVSEASIRLSSDLSLSSALSTEISTSVHYDGGNTNNNVAIFTGTAVNKIDGSSGLTYNGQELITDGDVVSPVFTSGFAGAGFKIDKEQNGDYSATFDNLTIRKMMKVYELQISKISAVNGGLIVSCANGKSIGISGTTQVWFDTNGGKTPIQFIQNDWVRAQQWDNGINYLQAQVDTVGSNYITLKNISGAIYDTMDLVQVGHPTNAARQAIIYITASDTTSTSGSGVPYIDMLHGVTNGNFSGKQKVRIGNLQGVSDSSFGGSLSGYGLWTDNVYLHGQIVISNTIPSGSVSGLGSLASQNSVDYTTGQVTNKPTIPTNTNQLTDGANLGGTSSWAGISSLPTGANGLISGTPGTAGLYMNGTYMGYWTGTAWKSYFDNNGNCKFGGVAELGTETFYYPGQSTYSNLAVKGADLWDNAGTNSGGLFFNRYTLYGATGGTYRHFTVYNGMGDIAMYVSPSNATIYMGDGGSGSYGGLNVWNLVVKGTVTGSDHILNSDIRVKDKIVPISNEYVDVEYKQFEMKDNPGRIRYGVVAQEIKGKYPELVHEDEDGMLSVSYIGLLIKEIVYLKEEVRKLNLK